MQQNMNFSRITLAFFLFLSFSSLAAEKPDSSGRQKPYERSLILGVEYSSDKVFYGRKGEERVLYISPSLFYQGRSGFYTGFASYRLLKPEKYWDQSQLTAGWDFKLLQKLQTSASYSRFAYNDSSVQIQSSLKNNFELSFSLDSAIIQPKLTGAVYFGSSAPDYLSSFELSHEFAFDYLFGDRDGLYIKPTAAVSAGTLHYYRLALRDSGQRLLAAREVTKFDISGIDFYLPVEYDIGRFIIGASANYNIPLNQPLYLRAEPGFYFTLGLGFRFI